MNSPAAFSGDYTDLRFIKTRSVAAITIEIPIEQASAFVAAFGAPVPASGCPVAIARIKPSVVREQLEASVALIDKPAKERRSWSALSYAEQAGIRCNEPAFWKFLNDDYADDVDSPEAAAKAVRSICADVKSRADILPHTEAGHVWVDLDQEYQGWLSRAS